LSKWKKDLKNIQEGNAANISPTVYNGKLPAYGKVIDLELFNLVKEKMLTEKSTTVCSDVILRELLLTLLQSHNKMNLLLDNGGACVFQKSWVKRFWKRYTNQLQEIKKQVESEQNFDNYLNQAAAETIIESLVNSSMSTNCSMFGSSTTSSGNMNACDSMNSGSLSTGGNTYNSGNGDSIGNSVSNDGGSFDGTDGIARNNNIDGWSIFQDTMFRRPSRSILNRSIVNNDNINHSSHDHHHHHYDNHNVFTTNTTNTTIAGESMNRHDVINIGGYVVDATLLGTNISDSINSITAGYDTIASTDNDYSNVIYDNMRRMDDNIMNVNDAIINTSHGVIMNGGNIYAGTPINEDGNMTGGKASDNIPYNNNYNNMNMSADNMNMPADNMNMPADNMNMIGNFNDIIIDAYTYGPNNIHGNIATDGNCQNSFTFQPNHIISPPVNTSNKYAMVTQSSLDYNKNSYNKNSSNKNKENKKAWNRRPDVWKEIGEYFDQYGQQSTVDKYPHVLKHLPYQTTYQKLHLWRKDGMMQRSMKPLKRVPEYGQEIDDELLNLVRARLASEERVSDNMVRSMLIKLLKKKKKEYLLRENGGENTYGSTWVNRCWNRWKLPARDGKKKKNNKEEDEEDEDDDEDEDEDEGEEENEDHVDYTIAEGTAEVTDTIAEGTAEVTDTIAEGTAEVTVGEGTAESNIDVSLLNFAVMMEEDDMEYLVDLL